MDLNSAILKTLSDGRFHSGQALARTLGVSRTAVWKRIAALQRMGLDMYAVRGRGYRLPVPVETLAARAIDEALPAGIREHIVSMELLFDTASTNQHLLDRNPVHGRVVLAEFQHSGRGRRGNQWFSPLGGGVCLSIGWHFDAAPDSLVLVSLLTGACAARALSGLGCRSIGLKWPNDLVWNGRKLGGVLIETRGQIAGPVDIVIGVGVNVHLPENVRAAIAQPVTDLAEIAGVPLSRNRVAASVIGEIVRMLSGTGSGIWDEYMREWRSRDVIRGKRVQLRFPGHEVDGIAEDVDPSGMLVLRVNGDVRRFSSGEVSLRVAT